MFFSQVATLQPKTIAAAVVYSLEYQAAAEQYGSELKVFDHLQ
jgi:hypothetical protein